MASRADELNSKSIVASRRVLARTAIVVLVLAIGLTVLAAFYWRRLMVQNSWTSDQLSQMVLWRVRLFGRKATGGVPDLSWSELWMMTHHQGGFGLEGLVLGVSADGSVKNSYVSDEDNEAAADIFGRRCAMCHGPQGIGWSGPPLNHPGLKHGDSDLAVYKVLRDGIPGTPMVSPGLSATERWQVVGYLKTLMIHGTGREIGEKHHLDLTVSSDRLRSAGSRPDEWLTYSGSFDGHRYTPLTEITRANVSQLRPRWIQQFNTSEATIEAAPLVVGGVIFTTIPPSNVVALDAKSGNMLWRYDRPVFADLALCCGRVNRGLAILGDTLFLGSLDGYLVAINAHTGKMIWETRVADPTDNYSMTGAPLIVGQSVVVGIAGGDFGIRGYLAAYDPATGKQNWKFDTVPGPGQTGHETWQGGDAWKTGGGATWVTGSYDPDLDLLYWGVGNPAPDFSGDLRPGDNLFTNSVIALHGATGQLAWHFQFTPHDEHDWDSTQTPVLADISIHGANRKVICWANRNGFYYVLDRTTGEFLTGVPFVEQNWAQGLDSKGRPILPDSGKLSSGGRLVKPASSGATNWQNTALDQARGLIFIPATEGASVFTKALEPSPRDRDRQLFLSSAATTPELPTLVVRALDAATGAKKWEYFSPSLKEGTFSHSYSGLLATGSGLVFGASGETAFALDSDTGRELWRVFLGGDTRAAPTSFTVDGHQVIAISAGRSLFLFGL
jgi:alcohol dehydrogenase (cytochrome c)